MHPPAAPQLHPITVNDRAGVLELFNARKFVHRHPGWRSVPEWLSSQPFWVLKQEQLIQAALACPVEPKGVAWVRLFASRFPNRPASVWPQLFEHVYHALPDPKPEIAALGLSTWFSDMLKNNGFAEHNRIIILFWDAAQPPAAPHLTPHLHLRQMTSSDLIHVLKLDHQAFKPMWQISWEALSSAFQQSAYATVVERNEQVIGYQISTTTHNSTCLERLAVSPDEQNQGIGASLVYDLIDDFQLSSAMHLTVNTQQDNLSSQTLYQKMGFKLSGESYPVFVYQQM
jgi:ribosomal protein S18 acetylase RimI-like enzyme